MVEDVQKQVEHVRGAVGEVPVHGVLCFVDSDWGFFPDAFTVNGLHVVWPRKLAAMLGKSVEPVLGVAVVAELIALRFVRA